MVRFYGSMKGAGSKSNTKMGQSNIEAHIRTWDFGVFVKYKILPNGKIRAELWTTGGSNDPTKKRLFKTFLVKDPGNIKPGPSSYGNARGNLVS